MSAGGPRKGRERFRYHTGCASPKQYLAQCAKRIASGPARIAQIQADLAEAQRRATHEIAIVEADVRDAELGRERMAFMLDENGRYVGARLSAMLDKFPLGLEASADSHSKRPRGRPRKDGRPPQPRSEVARAEARQRRALKMASAADITRDPDRDRRRATSRLDARSTDRQTLTRTHPHIAEAFSSHTTEIDEALAGSDAAPEMSMADQAEHSSERAEPPSPAPLPLPLVLPSLGRQVTHLLDGVAGDDLPIEVLTVADKTVEVFTPEADAERAKSRDVSRWPSAYNSTWADAWDPNPDSRLPTKALYSEPYRVKLWPLAIQRRDFIKALMERVALGEMSFEPASLSEADLARSVRWLVFRKADHDWLFDLSRWEIELYTQKLLDVIPWPPGLSRKELLGTFGCGQVRNDVPNMSSYGRPPLWLVPEEHWIYADNFGLRHAPGVDPAYKDRPRLKRVLDGTIQPRKTTRKRKRNLSSRSSLPALPLSDLAAPYHSTQIGNRLLELKPDSRTGYLSFAHPADVVRAELARGEAVRLGASHLHARAEWCEANPVLLDPETTMARIDRLAGLARETAEDTGLSALTLAYGIAFYGQEEPKPAAPLAVCPVSLTKDGEAYFLRQTGVPEWNQELLAALGLDQTGLPDDPLAWEKAAYEAAGITTILPIAMLGLFDLARHRHGVRLDPGQDRDLLEHPQVRRLLEGKTEVVWPQQPWRTISTPTQMTASLDRSQADVVDASREGLSFVVEGGPGTGKTQTIAHILTNAAVDGRSVLFLSGRLSAFRSALTRLGAIVDSCLQLYGVDCDPAGVATWCGVDPGATVRETLERVDGDAHPCIVLATPATYVTHIPPEWSFDLLVVDEASLIPLAAALPAVAACTQIVICGDPNQMQRDPPPWVLFDQDRPYVQPATLIDAAFAAGMPKTTLTHHYRSRHPRLMHASNRLSYDGRMWLCPSPATDDTLGFFATSIAGFFDPKTSTNPNEAEAIVDEIVRYKAAGGRGSIGVIALTQQQRDLIQRRIADRGLGSNQEAEGEDLLVADYNGVQGEERDLVLISLTFGRRPGETAWPMSFGSISMPGGEKRLNVIMTRARERLVLFTSFPKEALDPARCAGHANLYAYMLTAERTYCDDPVPWNDGVRSSQITGQYKGTMLGNAFGLKKPDADRYAAALYVTGQTDELTEKSEIAQYRKLGWVLVEIRQAMFADACGNTGTMFKIRDRIQRSVSRPTEVTDYGWFDRLDGY